MRITKEMKRQLIKPYFMKYDIYSVEDIKRKHRKYFFSKDTMRFFNSRLISDVFPTSNNKVIFITSEKKCFNDYSREFNVRIYDIETDSMETIVTVDTRVQALSQGLNAAYDMLSTQEQRQVG